jgi:hypothetical protein
MYVHQKRSLRVYGFFLHRLMAHRPMLHSLPETSWNDKKECRVTVDDSRVRAYIDEHWDRHLADVRTFVRQPSISADGTGMEECAQMIVGWIERLGGMGEIVPTKGWPVVYGRIDAGAPHTILL